MKRKNTLYGAFTTLATLAALATVACEPPEPGEGDADADVRTEHAQATEAGIFPDAPSDRVREAVRGAALDVEEGEASFYADTFEGRRTASGRTFRQQELVAAHRAFPFGTRLRVTNQRNGNDVEVTVVDRGPFGTDGNLAPAIDLSRAAAQQLDFLGSGRTQVRIEVLEWGPGVA